MQSTAIANWQAIKPLSRGHIRRMLRLKHGSLTDAAERLEMPYQRLSALVNGREYIIRHVETIQDDLGLSDSDVLRLWPLLKEWPKERKAG